MTVVGDSPSLVDNVRELWALNLFDYFPNLSRSHAVQQALT